MPPRNPNPPVETDDPVDGATSGRALLTFKHDGVEYRANDLFEGTEKEVAAHHAAGNIDAHPDAVELAVARPKPKKSARPTDEAIED